MNVKELMYDVDKRRDEIRDLEYSINSLRGIRAADARELQSTGTWEAAVAKDDRYAVQLLFKEYQTKTKELNNLLYQDVKLTDPIESLEEELLPEANYKYYCTTCESHFDTPKRFNRTNHCPHCDSTSYVEV